MTEEGLRITSSHGADEFQGSLFGIETSLFLWVALALLASLGLFAGLFYGVGLDFAAAMGWAVSPTALVIAYLRCFHQGKPPGYTFDLLDTLLTGGRAVPPRHQPPDPLRHV